MFSRKLRLQLFFRLHPKPGGFRNLGVVYQVTKEPIAAQQEKAKQRACMEVFADAASFEAVEAQSGAGEGEADEEEEGYRTPTDASWEEQGYSRKIPVRHPSKMPKTYCPALVIGRVT